jgi:hypothetical protein
VPSLTIIARRAAYVSLSVVLTVLFAAVVAAAQIAVLMALGVMDSSWFVWVVLVSGLSLSISIVLVLPVAPSLYRRLWVPPHG